MIVDGGPFGRPAFFRGGVSSCCGVMARAGGAGTSRLRGHTVFLLPDHGRLPSVVSPIHPIFVVYNSFHRIVLPLCSASMHARPYAACPQARQRPARGRAATGWASAVVLSADAFGRRVGGSAAEDFAQYKLHFVDDIHHDYEVIRPIVLFADTIAERSRQTGIERTVVGGKARGLAGE